MKEQTIVLNGFGPRVKVTSNANSKMVVIGKSNTKTINLAKSTDIKFAA